MFALTLAVAPYVEAQAMDITALKGRWVLEAINGAEVPVDNGEIFFEITDQNILGFDGCNRFGGSISQPFVIRKTYRGCDPETVLLPLDLANPAPQLSRATLGDDKLVLPMPDGAGEAQFRRGQ